MSANNRAPGGAPPDATDERAELARAVVEGLSAPTKWLPCKYLYDEAGSQLFDRICELPEYYPTRTETGILQACAGDIAAAVGPGAEVVELGSGASIKTRILLSALERPAAYVPVDISEAHMLAAVAGLQPDYPSVAMRPVAADFSGPFALPRRTGDGRRLLFFPGSTIGNLDPDEAEAFLGRMRNDLEPDAMVLGADLRKDPAILVPAYDDAAGVTAAFNLNYLDRINRDLGADFDRARFRHEARWNERMGRIEMHIVSRTAQTVRIGDRAYDFAEGESIHTENSHKFTLLQLRELAARAGWRTAASWTDDRQLFSVHLLAA